MNLHNVILNNKIPFVLLENNNSENVIYCSTFSDYIFNVGTFVTKTKEVILEYVTEGEEKYVFADVTFNNGTCFPGVRFKVIVNEHVETPHSTINLNQLQGGVLVQLPQAQPEIIEEEIVEPLPPPVLEPVSVPDYTDHVQQALQLEKHLQREKQAIEKQKILLEKQNLINKKLSEYKQELLEEYVNVADKQKNLLSSQIKENLTLVEQDLNLRITSTFNEYEIQLEEHKHKTKSEQLEFIIEKINESIESVQTELNDLVTGKFTVEQDHLQQVLQDKSQSLQEKYEQKLILELEKYKETLFEEFYLVSSDAIQRTLEQKKDLTEQQIIEAFNSREKTFNTLFESKLKDTTHELNSIVQQFSNRLPGIDDNIKLLEDKINSLIEEKKKLDDSGKFNTTQQKYIADTAQYWARRILDLGGGGGSVAVQYAKGGTMDGNLSVNNLYPNNNNGEIGSPTNRWDRIYANQIDSLSSNIVVELSGFFVDGNFTVNGTISALGGNSNQWNSTYNTMQANSAGWESVESTVYANSAKWESNYTTTNTYSGLWQSVYTTVSAFSASWEESAEILPTVTNYLSTNNVLLLSATVMDSLSVGGTIYTSTTADSVLKYSANVGNGIGSSFNIIHNFNTKDIVVSVYDNNTNIQAYPTVSILDFDTINLQFNFIPPSNAYKVVVLGTKPSNKIAAFGNTVNTIYALEKYQFKTSNFNVISGYYAVDTTSGPVRGTLPSVPNLGDTLSFIDTHLTWSTNNFILERNGNNIESLSQDLSANISGFAFKLTWVGGPDGWRLY